MKSVVFSPAKINLILEILRRREDGYHEISTIFHAIKLSDKLTFDWSAPKSSLSCDNPELPSDENNLIFKAIRAVEKLMGAMVSVAITLEKKIPFGAGLGGGSSNAAVTLKELGDKFKIPDEKLFQIAASLGSDVPFFLKGGTALGKGKGEELVSLPQFPVFPLVLVKPPFSISTPLAYGKIRNFSSGEKTLQVAALLNENGRQEVFKFLTNDFEQALFPIYPDLRTMKEFFLSEGALMAQLSGSGSALFAIAPDSDHAERLAEKAKKFGEVFVTST